jgi:hypothetical protein
MNPLLAPPMKKEDFPTIEEIKKKYGLFRNLEIEEHSLYKGRVETFSYDTPCVRCGEYHEPLSKEERECFEEGFREWGRKPMKETCPCCGHEVDEVTW